MSSERDLIIDFIEWLEDNKRIYLMDITDNKDRFVTVGAPSDFTELESLIAEYQKDVDV